MKIVTAKLKTEGAFTKGADGGTDFGLWKNIEEYMDGETAIVIESALQNGMYLFLALEDEGKNKQLHYMIEQDSMIGVYIDEMERFNADWDSGQYESDGCIYLDPENVELVESGGTE